MPLHPRTDLDLFPAHELVLFLCLVILMSACAATPGFTRLSSKPLPKPSKAAVSLQAGDCETCHPAEYAQWRTSMHAYAQRSPVFLAFNAFVLTSSGGTIGVFCERCHTAIGISAGESAIEPNSKRSALALEGVTCMTCHSQHRNFEQASAQIPVPVPGDTELTVYGPYYGSDEVGAPPGMRLIDSPHRSRFSPLFTSGNLCGACHDVFSPDGFRIEEAYSEWKNGPYARRGIACENCHMGPEPGRPTDHDHLPMDYIVDSAIFPAAPKRHRSIHTFTGPDYSMIPGFGQNALALGNKHFARLEEHLEMERETLLKNAATMEVSFAPQARPGSTVKVRVAVTNSGAGHNLPTGFASERQIWLEVAAIDARGRRIFVSGDLDRYRDLRDYESMAVQNGAAPVDADLFNLEAAFVLTDFLGTQSNGISTTNRLLSPVPFVTPPNNPASLQGFPFAGRVFKEGIPPLATKTATYAIPIPADAAGPINVTVRLRYRNFPAHFLRDLKVGDLVPKLRIVDLSSYEGTIALAP